MRRGMYIASIILFIGVLVMAYVHSTHSEYVYFEDNDLKVCEPKIPLAPGAIEIVVKDTASSSVDEKIFAVYQTTKEFWKGSKTKAPGCYYLERHEGPSSIRQIIPYPHDGFRSYARQLQVTWNLLFPRLAVTHHTSEAHQSGLKEALAKLHSSKPIPSDSTKCPFCDPKRIAAQLILEQGNLRLLYNYKPLSQHDFLIVTKEHLANFDDKSFAEAIQIGKKSMEEYAKKGFPIWYLTFADDASSGQTVKHAHLHATNATGYQEEVFAIAKVVRKILLDSWMQFIVPSLFKLSDDQLKVKIEEEKKNLQTVFPDIHKKSA
jgi:diadenosine tetraphosphate (Ap4A) HIT family hydrolase